MRTEAAPTGYRPRRRGRAGPGPWRQPQDAPRSPRRIQLRSPSGPRRVPPKRTPRPRTAAREPAPRLECPGAGRRSSSSSPGAHREGRVGPEAEKVIPPHLLVVVAPRSPRKVPDREVDETEQGAGYLHEVVQGAPQPPMTARVDVHLPLDARRNGTPAPANVRTAVVQVDDRRVRIVPDPPTAVPDPVTPLHVFPVHEVRLREPTGLFEHAPRTQHERARHPVHIPLLVLLPVSAGQHFPAARTRQQLVESKVLENREPDAGKAICRVLKPAIRHQQPAMRDPQLRLV